MVQAESVAVVTGGAQGIGWAIARGLLSRGAKVYVCDISDEDLEKVQREGRHWQEDGKVALARCDVSDHEAFRAWIGSILDKEGKIDIIVNNAMYTRWENAVDLEFAESLRTVEVGLLGVIRAVDVVLPAMLQQKSGCIVNVGSSAGKLFVGGASAVYAGVKAAIDGYTQTLQVELHGTGVRAILVRPGIVTGTNFFRRYVRSTRMPRFADWLPHLTPEQVGNRVVDAIVYQEDTVNVPGWLPAVYLLFEIAPGPLRWLARAFGESQHDYGEG